MNWAIIAPESRLYKGKDLFRWDVSPGLEHHCGICATPLHNARARTSCIGKHVEPCYRFHQQLHFIGRSHECFGCNNSDEMHYNRHKKILTLVRKITALDDTNNPNIGSPASLSVDKSRRGSANTTSTTTTPTETSSDFGDEGAKMKRSERKKAKKLGLGSANKKRKVELFLKEDIDFISEAIHLRIHETKGAWEGNYIYDIKQPKSEHSIPEVEKVEDLVDRTTSLSVKAPSGPGTSALTPRQRKCVKTFSTAVKIPSFRGGSRKFSHDGLSNDPFNGIDPHIFFRLGIEVINPVKNSAARKDLVAKLVAAIKCDLAIITQEDEETELRREGFWRWAGKTAYQEIMKRREELDWATGQKIRTARKESIYYEEEFVLHGTDAEIVDRDDAMTDSGQTIETLADDDPPATNEKSDFAVAGDPIIVTEERIEQEWEMPSAKHTFRKRHTEGGRAFRMVAKSGGPATLRIVAT